MNILEKDLSVLLDDYERVVALERLNAPIDDPTYKAVAERWVIAHEGILDKAVGWAGDKSERVLESGVRLSFSLVERLFDWFEARRKSVLKQLKEMTSVARLKQSEIVKLDSKVRLSTIESTKDITTGKWLSKLCIEDKFELDKCIAYAYENKKIEDVTHSYTVQTANAFRSPRKSTLSGNDIGLRKISKPTASAIKRAAPLLGLGSVKPGRGVEAWPLPGNVIVTLDTTVRGVESINFAVARDGELPETITSLSKEQMEKALKAAYHLTEQLIERGVTRKAFSYGGIYDTLEDLRKAIDAGEMEPDEIRAAKRRLANAINIEDALTTSMVRVCEGLIEIVKRSL